MDATTDFCVVMTTVGSDDEAATLARDIVAHRLGACVQVQAIRSFYVWKGQACDDQEQLLMVKTRQALYPALERFIRERHSYETPEILQLPVLAGLPNYLDWVRAQTAR